jgi:hypothetical protein
VLELVLISLLAAFCGGLAWAQLDSCSIMNLCASMSASLQPLAAGGAQFERRDGSR